MISVRFDYISPSETSKLNIIGRSVPAAFEYDHFRHKTSSDRCLRNVVDTNLVSVRNARYIISRFLQKRDQVSGSLLICYFTVFTLCEVEMQLIIIIIIIIVGPAFQSVAFILTMFNCKHCK